MNPGLVYSCRQDLIKGKVHGFIMAGMRAQSGNKFRDQIVTKIKVQTRLTIFSVSGKDCGSGET